MKLQRVTTSVLLFSTILGVSVPVQDQFTQQVAYADTDVSSTMIADISQARDEVQTLVKTLSPNMTDDATSQSPLVQTYDTHLSTVNTIETQITAYEAGKLSRSQFLTAVKNIETSLINLATPVDWQAEANLVAALLQERQTEISQSGIDQSALSTNIAKYQKYTDATTISKNTLMRSKTGLSMLWNNLVNALLQTSVDTDTDTGDTTLHDDQRTFANFMLTQLATMRQTQIKQQAVGTDASKQTALAMVTQSLANDKAKLADKTLTKTGLISLVKGFYSEYAAIIPVTTYNQASDSDRSTAIAQLQATYESVLAALNQITGYDTDVAVAKQQLSQKLATYESQIGQAQTSTAINSVMSTGQSALTALKTLKPTSDELASTLAEIQAAATAQKQVIDQDDLASTAQKLTAKATIDAQVTKYTSNANMATTTVQVLTTIKKAAISTIQATQAMHTAAATATTSTEGGLTTDQINAAINAVITTGNRKKVGIQDDQNVAANLKVAAYAAVDKLVTNYENQLRRATTLAEMTAIQASGQSAVNAFSVSAKASSTDSIKADQSTKIVYAIGKVKLYKHASLTGSVVATYAKQKRTKRPMFKVVKKTQNSDGQSVFAVKAIRSGQTGYLTASRQSVVNAYYQTTPKTIKVIATKGINQYQSKQLTGKKMAVSKGRTLRVKKLIKLGLTSRFELTNGHYVSANKKLVLATKY
ncbi:hypothetical protein FD04_GL000320 [Secundilactobacillus odoratitofui DSM 19909 = JCM 15043]|uniref:DUF5776 domain-containing protein n=1 Tax=Secundilactobacillus odoratitofui DSM 19909 = JCM 15043 TaxID=1423776 RepID=A0A0R1LRW5_9LACO|nr:DUF5776 domain-containing protein [Secundilactobacillus odoratitofui]KRK98588.1 hypothetical protein FD04_GL000320 [Secundilactobacillus odoratitofui DSM 19909 = JCM 15043]